MIRKKLKKVPKQKVPSAIETYQEEFCFIRAYQSACKTKISNRSIENKQSRQFLIFRSAKMKDATFLSVIDFLPLDF